MNILVFMRTPHTCHCLASLHITPVSCRPRPGRCLIYSVGVGGEFSWDYAMKRFNCSVLAFDMTMMNWTNIQLATGFHFLDLGLADVDNDVSGSSFFLFLNVFTVSSFFLLVFTIFSSPV